MLHEAIFNATCDTEIVALPKQLNVQSAMEQHVALRVAMSVGQLLNF